MGAIEDVYADLDTDVSIEEFREAVESKVEQMGGLADEETAAMLIAHGIDDGEVNGVADIDSEMDEVKFIAKVTRVGDVRTFDREDADDDDDAAAEGRVVNVTVADETDDVRVSLWDEQATAAADDLAPGDVLRIKGRPTDGYNGLEVSADEVELDADEQIDVQIQDEYDAADLSLGVSDVTLVGEVLDTEAVRTFDRDDGSEGRVSNLVVGDETGRVRVTLWDDQADTATDLDAGAVVEIVDGYVREREGSLELHVGDTGAVTPVPDADVSFVPDTTSIDSLEQDNTADIAGVVRSVDPTRTFDRDDGSEGQVRNVRLQDDTGDIRVALWGEKADLDVGPGDEVAALDVEIQDGWQDDIEASAGWQASVIPLSDSTQDDAAAGSDGPDRGLAAFGADSDDEPAATDDAADTQTPHSDTPVEFTGVVVQAQDPLILDDGEETMSVTTDADVTLGQEVTVRGSLDDGRLHADDVTES
ncbi:MULTISPECIES: single-stranded DNA binding protein [Halobacterium]|uniref:single-stranded DNA binding protein n=1 Tax=Halobacterium TaxID=2239 RepID=UPI001963925F|nr:MULTISPECIES: single-stranded DNA binding protein [Halobacterium]MCF2166064.1 single-stranded DNA binding protein [Halobacterium salinarum]MCF2166842.1 single-stranded DNA binding protein [Halobacterium salinarum]MCF2237752.1 single-stranded DNA binding protein [Halobacterium salinarum]QRY22817.1 single-stranded DNA binding protein [Halobacterium sp. GSL-19]